MVKGGPKKVSRRAVPAPAQGFGADNKPRGETRYFNGRLEQRESDEEDWRPAVRLDDLRAQYLREASQQGIQPGSQQQNTYDFPKEGVPGTNNQTAFLLEDKAYGKDRDSWPELLFQLLPEPNEAAQRPIGILMDRGRVVIDPDNHEIRDFPELPKVLSSELSGQDIEYYLRKNMQFGNGEMGYIDLRARMPSTFAKGKKAKVYDAPKPNALSMRASRFRWPAPCLAWTIRDASDKLEEYVLSVLPPECIPENSTEAFGRTFTKAEQAQAKEASKGKFANRRRKDKRTAEAEEEDREVEAVDEELETDEELDSLFWDEDSDDDAVKSVSAGPSSKRKWSVSLESEDGGSYQPISKRRYDKVTSHRSEGLSSSTEEGQSQRANIDAYQPKLAPATGQKRGRDQASIESGEEEIIRPALKRSRKNIEHWEENARAQKIEQKMKPCGTDTENLNTGLQRYRKRGARRSMHIFEHINPPTPHGTIPNPDLEGAENDPALSTPEVFGDKVDQAILGGIGVNTDPLALSYLDDSTDETLIEQHTSQQPAVYQQPASPVQAGNANSKRKNNSPSDQLEDERCAISGPVRNIHRRQRNWTSGLPHYEEAHRKPQQDRQPQVQQSLEPQSDSTLYVGAESHITEDVAGPPSGFIEDFDPTSIEFQAETYAGIGLNDYRYMAPIDPVTGVEDAISVDRALMLTRMDFCQLVGQYPPNDPTGTIQFESYASQYRRLQQAFSMMWDGNQPAPALYCLPAWDVGFEWWEASDPRGQELLAAVEDSGW